MNQCRSITWKAAVLAATIVPASRAEAQDFFSEQSSAADIDPALLFEFDTPSGTVGAGEVVVAKIVTDDANGDNLEFRVDTVSFGFESFTVHTSVEIKDGLDDVALVFADQIEDATDPADLYVEPAPGYRLIKVILRYTAGYEFAASEKWRLRVQPPAGTSHFHGCWAGGADEAALIATCTAPRIGYLGTDPLDFGDVHVGIDEDYAPALPVNIQNVGTDDLTLTTSLTGPDASSFSREQALVPLKPGAELPNVWGADNSVDSGLFVVAEPTTPGARTATLTLNSATESLDIGLSADGFLLYAHLLLDVSGSMGSIMENNLTRLEAAVDAAKELNNWVNDFSDGAAWLGLSTFPGPTSGDSAVPVKIDTEENNHGAINTALSGFSDRNSTPMESGIQAAFEDMQGGDPGTSELRQTILLLTDGHETGDSDAASQESTLDAAGVRVFTVGVGDPGDINETLLKQLAYEEDWFTQADSDDANAVKKNFVAAAQEWLSLEPLADPQGTIQPGQERSHEVCVEDAAYGLTVSVDWARNAPGGIEVTLETPTGELITPDSKNVFYHAGNTFAQYTLLGDLLRGGRGAGFWTLHLEGGSSLPAEQDTTYVYSVLAQSNIRAESDIDSVLVATGITAEFTLSLIGLNAGYASDLVVTAEVEAPDESFQSWLASNEVQPEWVLDEADDARARGRGDERQGATAMQGVAQQEAGDELTMVQRKVAALQTFADLTFDNARRVTALKPAFDEVEGLYRVAAPVATYDGVYRYHVTVDGTLPGGGCLRRDYWWTRSVGLTLDADLVASAVEWIDFERSAFFDERVFEELQQQVREDYVQGVARITPQDARGNLFGMGRVAGIDLEIRDGEPVGSLVDNWDGSYLQVIEYPEGASPRAVVNVDGVTSTEVDLTGAGQDQDEDEAPSSPCGIGTCGAACLTSLGLTVLGLLSLRRGARRWIVP